MIARKTKRRVLYTAVLLCTGLILYIYAFFNPESSILFPKCIFLQLTGFRCPGCGSQRALHALLTGNITAAFQYNAMLVSLIPYIVLLSFASSIRTKAPKLYAALCNPTLISAVFILILMWWILRNIFGW